MVKTILYFHGFASSSDSNKAKIFFNYISENHKNIKLETPDLDNNFRKAVSQIKDLIKTNDKPIAFLGSSLGGYYAQYFSQKYKSKAILINPAIPPLEGFEIHLGENENYSTGDKFFIEEKDIEFIRSLYFKNFKNQENTLILLESHDEVLNYQAAVSYFKGSNIDIIYGGDHSFSSFNEKLSKMINFLEI